MTLRLEYDTKSEGIATNHAEVAVQLAPLSVVASSLKATWCASHATENQTGTHVR